MVYGLIALGNDCAIYPNIARYPAYSVVSIPCSGALLHYSYSTPCRGGRLRTSAKTTPGTRSLALPDWPLPPPARSGAATPGDRPWTNPRARWPGHHIIPPTWTQLPGSTRHRVIGQEPSPLPSRRWIPLIFRCTVPERVILVIFGTAPWLRHDDTAATASIHGTEAALGLLFLPSFCTPAHCYHDVYHHR